MLTVVLHQANHQTSVDTESIKAAETETGTGTEKMTGAIHIGPPPGITVAINPVGTGMNVITGHPEIGMVGVMNLEIVTGQIPEVQIHTSVPGLRSRLCHARLRQGLCTQPVTSSSQRLRVVLCNLLFG